MHSQAFGRDSDAVAWVSAGEIAGKGRPPLVR
jgi:hypothetical protein